MFPMSRNFVSCSRFGDLHCQFWCRAQHVLFQTRILRTASGERNMQRPCRGCILRHLTKIDGSLARNIHFEVANCVVIMSKLLQKRSVLSLQLFDKLRKRCRASNMSWFKLWHRQAPRGKLQNLFPNTYKGSRGFEGEGCRGTIASYSRISYGVFPGALLFSTQIEASQSRPCTATGYYVLGYTREP